MKSTAFRRFFSVFTLVFFAASGCGYAEDANPASSPSASPEAAAKSAEGLKETMIFDFENEDGSMVNNIGGDSGSWNMDPMDENNSYCDADIVEIPDSEGKPNRALRMNYSVESDVPSQNGFWTKLKGFDASGYDHLEFDIKGDAAKGFTNIFKLELKKIKPSMANEEVGKDEKIKGTAKIPVTDQWAHISIQLNTMTGIINFIDPEAWKNPAIARKDLDEFVVVFHDRMVSKKTGTIYLDNIKFVNNNNPGPTAVDFPPRKKEKTPTKIEGMEFQKFLMGRLKGFPKVTVVKKEFPADDKAFLKEIAKDTWRFFDEIVDKDYALPLDTIQLAPKGDVAFADGAWIGDYTNVTNIGVYLMCLVSAFDLGFISEEDAVARIRHTMTTLENLEYHKSGFPYNYYDTTTAERTNYLVSLVDSGWLLAGLYVVKNAFPEQLEEQASKLLARGNLGFFYDDVEQQFFHGYYDHLQVYSDYHYGVFYTEPRATSFIAIARGEVPKEHWFGGLMRTFPESYGWQNQKPKHQITKKALGLDYKGGYYEWKDLKYVPSWGGSAFEALMPTLILNEKELAPEGLGANDKAHVMGQIRFALEEEKMPVWGMSPSSKPEGGYSEYGAKPFGSKGYKSGVVTPHAVALSLEFAPQEAIKNLRKLIELYDVYGEYGFYDAVTVKPIKDDPNSVEGLIARKYLALDQGMLFVAINNYLNDGAIRKRFHADPVMKKGEELLTSEKFFEAEAPAAEPAAV